MTGEKRKMWKFPDLKSGIMPKVCDSGILNIKIPSKFLFTGLFWLVLTIPLLFTGCDMFGGSIDKFINYNTGNVRIVNISAAGTFLKKTKQAWMYDPPNFSNGIMDMEVLIDNPQNYDIVITPRIDEFIGEDGISIKNPSKPINVSHVMGNIYSLTIGSSLDWIKQGDYFQITFDISTKDGVRVFNSEEIYKIVYDSPLESASKPVIETTENTHDGHTYEKSISWTTQNSAEHVGINKISIDIANRSETPAKKNFVYVYKKDNAPKEKWELEPKDINGEIVEGAEYYKYLIFTPEDGDSQPRPKYELPFPFISGGEYIDTAFLSTEFSVIVTLYDKNGLYSFAGEGAHPGTYLEDLTIYYLYNGESEYRKSEFKFFDNIVVYGHEGGIPVPNSVERVMFVAEKNKEYPTQEVRWGTSTYSEMEKSFPLLPGLRTFIMKVYYVDPNKIDSENDPETQEYSFTIRRLSPNTDSDLKRLTVKGYKNSVPSTLETYYDEVNPLGIKQLTHTVYVPSSVDTVRISGQYLNLSDIYNEKGWPGRPPATGDGSPDLRSKYPLDYPEKMPGTEIDYMEYYSSVLNLVPEDDLTELEKNPLYITHNGWEYDLDTPGVYTKYFFVKSENDYTSADSRCYTITIIRTDEQGNPNAKIKDLSLTASGITLPVLLAKDNSMSRYVFDPDVLDYNIDVPSDVSSLSLSLEPDSLAEIWEITYADINGANPYALSYTPPVKQKVTIPISPLPAFGNKKRITLTVYSNDIYSTPKNYTITLIRCLSNTLSSIPKLASFNNSLEVTWGSMSGATKYEIRYSPDDLNPNQIPERAWKWDKNINPLKEYVTGLENGKKHYIWVRGLIGDIPGNWTPADYPAGNNGIGVPGPAELKDIEFNISPAAPALTLDFVKTTMNYTLTIPSGTTSLSFPLQVEPGYPAPSSSPTTYTIPGQGNVNTLTITAYPPDKNAANAKDYKITVIQLLKEPSNFKATSLDGGIKLDWTNVSGLTYEIYYQLASIIPTSNFESTASRITNISAGTYTINSLVNAVDYNFWIRAVKGDVKGEWISSPVMEMPKSSVKILKNLTLAVESQPLSMDAVFDPATPTYNASTSTTGKITISFTLDNIKQKVTTDSSHSIEGEGLIRTIEITPLAGVKVDVFINVVAHIDKDTPGEASATTQYKVSFTRLFEKPANLTLVPDDGKIYVTGWNPVLQAGSYEIYYYTTDLNPLSIAGTATRYPSDTSDITSIPTSGSPIELSGITNGVQYYVWVRAKNASVFGEFSLSAKATPAACYLNNLIVSDNQTGLTVNDWDHTFAGSNCGPYEINVGYKTSSIKLTASPPSGATVTGGNVQTYGLGVGHNNIYIHVTAQNGTSIDYTLDVVRANPSENVALSNITIKDGSTSTLLGSLVPVAPPDPPVMPIVQKYGYPLVYEVSVGYGVTSIKVNAYTVDLNAEVLGEGNYSLNVGVNNIPIIVVPESGVGDSVTYTLEVTQLKPPIDNTLDLITIDDGSGFPVDINPLTYLQEPGSDPLNNYIIFDAGTVGAASITITVDKTDPDATVICNGVNLVDGVGSIFNLSSGPNTIYIYVISKSGQYSLMTYVIKVEV